MSYSIRSRILSFFASRWPNPVRQRTEKLGAEPGSDEFERAYAVAQYTRKMSSGLRLTGVPPLWGLKILEVGCGHGGISCYLAGLGAKSVVGIDLNRRNLVFADELKGRIERESGRPLAATFLPMNATELAFADASIDLVYADNVFEHFTEPQAVLAEMHRVLKPGGLLVAPIFSSIKSKYGLHLKHGLKLPWANLLFSEKTIIEAMRIQAAKRPELLDLYPGLRDDPRRVRDLRRYGDLNDITYRSFRQMAQECGFRVKKFRLFPTPLGRVLRKIAPRLERSKLLEILSTGAAALLQKTSEESIS